MPLRAPFNTSSESLMAALNLSGNAQGALTFTKLLLADLSSKELAVYRNALVVQPLI